MWSPSRPITSPACIWLHVFLPITCVIVSPDCPFIYSPYVSGRHLPTRTTIADRVIDCKYLYSHTGYGSPDAYKIGSRSSEHLGRRYDHLPEIADIAHHRACQMPYIDQWPRPPLSSRYRATRRLQSSVSSRSIEPPQVFRVTVFHDELICSRPESYVPFLLRVQMMFPALSHRALIACGRHRDSRHAMYENASTGSRP